MPQTRASETLSVALFLARRVPGSGERGAGGVASGTLTTNDPPRACMLPAPAARGQTSWLPEERALAKAHTGSHRTGSPGELCAHCKGQQGCGRDA